MATKLVNGVRVEMSSREQDRFESLRNEDMEKYLLVEYREKRAAEYPPIVDQLDLIFHEGLDAWKAEIQAVKDKYPKPEEER